MVTQNSQKNQLVVTIPNRNILDLQHYHLGILNLLANVEIENCTPELKENIKAVYELLSHLQPEPSLVNNTPGNS